MAEKHIVEEKNITDAMDLVTPLDNPRTFDHDHTVLGTVTSGVAYNTASGKVCYLHQMLVCELSGNAGKIRLRKLITSGNPVQTPATPWIPVEAAESGMSHCVCWSPCGCPLGPFYSGITYETVGLFGEVTLIVQVDPRRLE